jgi:hypothetical protein
VTLHQSISQLKCLDSSPPTQNLVHTAEGGSLQKQKRVPLPLRQIPSDVETVMRAGERHFPIENLSTWYQTVRTWVVR